LLYQAGKRRKTPVVPPPELRTAAITRLLDELPAGQNKSYLDNFDFNSTTPPPRFVAEILNILPALKKPSNPGLPLCYSYDTIEAVLDTVPVDVLVSDVWARVCALRAAQAVDFQDPVHMVQKGLVDPVRVFVKNELHSAEKVAQGRMRLIMVLSMTDQIVERWLSGSQNRVEIFHWDSIPGCPGMGLHDEGLEILLSKIQQMKDPVATDVSGFDWQVEQYNLSDDACLRAALAGCPPGSSYYALVTNRAKALGNSVIVLSDGRAYTQSRPGVQKSGSYNTSSTNTHIRLSLAYMAGAPLAMAMGDDCVEDAAPGAAEFYQKYFPLKSYSPGHAVDFCSMEFHLDAKHSYQRFSNQRWDKQLSTLLCKTPTAENYVELVSALVHNFRHQRTRFHEYFMDYETASYFLTRWGWGPRENKTKSNG
jgi:hypothetical protein